ncbi:MAG: prepilin-type N-terminal cleavage/methylation domain-containing protein [Candidatus Gastranaerophilales bacterium]|nr:prepilin-type N-terminal cleavage/methylation domain-containing protein [Candidatus Gastranaerophilales bacterium]
MYTFNKGFTLAEVLITLLIIGVISSIVIPAIIQDSREAELKTAVKKAYVEISGVVRQMKLDNVTLNDYIGNFGSFKLDFIKYFNVIKDCGNVDCVPSSAASDIYKSLAGDPATTSIGGEGQFVISNGMFINIQNSSSAELKIIIIVDVNGYIKGPNVYGKDTFMFDLVNDVLLPMGAPGTYYSTASYCNKSSSSAYQGFGCAVNVLAGIDY